MAALRSLSSHSDSPHRLQARTAYPYLHLYLPPGTPRRGGFARLCAYIAMRARGTQTPATATTAGCSSFFRRGGRSAAEASRTLRARVSSYTAPTSSTGATATRGANGAPRTLAGSGDAWERANRKALGL